MWPSGLVASKHTIGRKLKQWLLSVQQNVMNKLFFHRYLHQVKWQPFEQSELLRILFYRKSHEMLPIFSTNNTIAADLLWPII